jgi:hypothetical protein
MDMRQAVEDERFAATPENEAGLDDDMFDLGGDERRMHVRAYNHWVSLLKGRPYPSIADLEPDGPDGPADFGPQSVLLHFGEDVTDPGIAYLGRTLREECGLDAQVTRVADVPGRSLLSRLTDHYLQIIANRAPIGFEAEFVGTRGRTTLYRGILMPFSSAGGDAIDYVYGVINWKELADPVVQATLDVELAASMRAGPAAGGDVAVWADGPGATVENDPEPFRTGSLADTLMMARETAAAVRAADTRSRASLYRALGRAHDFGLAAEADMGGYHALLADTGIVPQARAPMTPIVKLVFGADYDKTRLTEFAAVLGHARRHGIAAGRLSAFLDGFEGGIKAVVAAERIAKKPAIVPTAPPALADRAVLARVPLAVEAATGDAVVLVARMNADGILDIVAQLTGSAGEALATRALRSGKPATSRAAAAETVSRG